MTTTVTMLQTRLGEEGSLWTVGNSYAASDAFAAVLISSNLATGTLPKSRALVPLWGQTDATGAVASVVDTAGNALIPIVGGSKISSAAAATANTSALQSALDVGGLVQILAPGTYEINSRLVIGDDTEFRLARGVKLKLRSGSTTNMIVSRSTATPAGVGTGDVTSGSNVITTTLGATAVVGQTIVLAGAGANGQGPLVGNISARTGTTITLVKQDGTTPANASATVSGAVCTLYTRNRNIKIIGGSWDRGDNLPDSGTGPGTAIAGHSLFLQHIDGLTVDLERVDSTHGITFVWITDCTDFQATVRSGNVVRTIMQLVGPLRNGVVPLVSGGCNDDMINICGNVYVDQTDTAGDVDGVSVGDILANGVGGSALKINAGTGCTVDKVSVKSISGNANVGLFMGDDYAHASTIGGNYGTIKIGYLGTVGYGANPKSIYCFTPNVKSLVIEDGVLLPFDPIFMQGTSVGTAIDYMRLKFTAAPTVTSFLMRCFDKAAIKQLDLVGLNVNASTTISVLRVYGTAVVNRVVVDKSVINFAGADSVVIRIYETGVVDEAMIRDSSVTYDNTTGTTNPIYVSAGTCKRASFIGGKMKNGAALIRIDAGVMCEEAHIAGCVVDTPDRLIAMRNTTMNLFLGAGIKTITPGNGQIMCNNASGVYNIYGSDFQCNTATAKLARITGTETINVFAPTLGIDLALVTKAANQMATNTNAGLSCGVGPAVANGTAWKNTYSAATY